MTSESNFCVELFCASHVKNSPVFILEKKLETAHFSKMSKRWTFTYLLIYICEPIAIVKGAAEMEIRQKGRNVTAVSSTQPSC